VSSARRASVTQSSADTSAAPYVKNGTEHVSAASATTADVFAWERNWWPVMPLAALDPTRPTPIELLGMQLVVWQDGSGTWRCFQDACPHRLAPLSGEASYLPLQYCSATVRLHAGAKCSIAPTVGGTMPAAGCEYVLSYRMVDAPLHA
jgi:hypothetical protein